MVWRLGYWFGLCSVCALAQTTYQVGGGLTATIQATFVTAYQRGIFSTLVGAPLGDVSNFGPSGLIQTFPGAVNPLEIFALIKPDSTTTANVEQVWNPMYQYYSFVTLTSAGFPTADTANCPTPLLAAAAGNSCQWQPFSNDYALFVYNQSIPNLGQGFLMQDPFFTLWNALGGVTVLGPAISMETQVTSRYRSAATKQQFDRSAMFHISAGPASGQLLAVKEPIYDLYVANGADQGTMGLPLTAEQLLANGMHLQAFERGAIQYNPQSNPATLVAVLLPAVASVAISAGTSIQMYPDEPLTVQSSLAAADGAALSNRPVVWVSSNPAVVQINGSGPSVTLLALTYGTASVTATAEGQTSPALVVSVTTSFCCQVGQGAPTPAIQQAFQDAVARDGLNVQAASGVTRVGNGYVQQLVSAAAPGVPYLVAVADSAGAAYIVTGAILSQYLQLGGPSGLLGYPLGDATAGGRQTFQNGALAGNPLQLVTGAILAEWKSLGYETGAAGAPTSAVTTFLTFRGTTGNTQSFQNGPILAATVGSLSGQGFFVTGLVLATYSAGGGPGGNLGAPISAESTVNGLRQQNFEGGYITYSPGDTKAVEHDTPRQPLITATPGAVRAGTSVRLVIGGFNNGATVRVSQTGQAAFLVTTPGGSYTFDAWVPATTAPGTVTVTASDTNSTATAQSSYTVYTLSASLMTVSIVGGNQQTGAPGALLTQPLVVVVNDQDGNPVAGQSVAFAASPGATALPATVITGAGGTASATLRMPAAAGIALATAQTAGHLVTFSAQSAAFSLGNFPALTQAVSGTLGNGSDTIQNKGALLTSVASILQYYQSLGDLPQPNGLATPMSLNQFLTSFCTFDSAGSQICDGFVVLGSSAEQTVNLWRVGAFVSNSVTVQMTVQITPFTSTAVADLVAAGSPVLLALSLGSPGSHFVVAFGINADGSLAIADPNPAFAQTNLNGYLNGFSAGGQTIQGTVTGAVRLLPQQPASPGFVVASNAPVALTSAAGSCGPTLQFPDTAAVAGAASNRMPGALYFGACDGTAAAYELDAGPGSYNLTFTDLSPNGGRTFASGPPPASYQIVSNGQNWTLSPLAALIAENVVNAASYTTAIAPGGLISIFGAGLAGPTAVQTTVQINGQAAKVVAATPFQVNAQVPYGVSAGTAQLTVTSANGSAQQQVAISSVAPAIFSISAAQAAITNLDNSLNAPSNPARRGSYLIIYATGFGAVSAAGAATTPLSVVIGGLEIPAAYAGASSGGAGLNQANVLLPATMPPGLALPLYLKQGGVVSNTVTVAIQ
jgi:uncharacterized protein (TIGR03437 family)